VVAQKETWFSSDGLIPLSQGEGLEKSSVSGVGAVDSGPISNVRVPRNKAVCVVERRGAAH